MSGSSEKIIKISTKKGTMTARIIDELYSMSHSIIKYRETYITTTLFLYIVSWYTETSHVFQNTHT